MSSEEKRTVQRKLAYSLAAGASAAAAGEVDAEIVYNLPINIEIVQGNSQELEIDGDGYQDIILKNYVFGGGNYQGALVPFAPSYGLPGTGVIGFQAAFPYVSLLSPLDPIDDDSFANPVISGSMAYGSNNPNAEFNDVVGGYIGVRFPINSFPHYGWIRVSVDNAAGTFVIHDFAYNSSTRDFLDEQGNPVLDQFGDPKQIGVPLHAGQVAGDHNRDGRVDIADYTAWRDSLGATVPAGEGADADYDGEITPIDYGIWVEDFGFDAFVVPETPAPPVMVPEPVTLGLLAAGAGGLALLRSRRRDPDSRKD